MPISVASPPETRGLAAPLAAIVRVTLAREERTAGEIAIVLAGDATLRELNRRWRGIDRATDVLSFGYDEAAGSKRALRPGGITRRAVTGDLVISLDRMREQARRYRVSPGRELARLAIHGALHLAGLDHQRAAERARMRRREAGALRAVTEPIARLDRCLGGGARRRARGSSAGD